MRIGPARSKIADFPAADQTARSETDKGGEGTWISKLGCLHGIRLPQPEFELQNNHNFRVLFVCRNFGLTIDF